MSELKDEVLQQYISSKSRRRFLSVTSKVAGLGAASLALNAQTGTNNAANDLNVLNYALTLEFLEATFYVQFLGPGSPPAGSTSLSGLTGTVTGNPRAFTTADLGGASGFQGFPAQFGAGLFALLMQIRDHEVTHVAALIQTIRSLGGTPTQPCTYSFPVTDINSFLKTAQALENTGVSAYDGAINMISNPMLVQTGATIATVEARHASFLNLIAGGGLGTGNFQPAPPSTSQGGTPAIPGVSASPFPTAFDTPLPMAQVLAIATPFLSSCPVPLQSTSLIFSLTPAASTTAPFSAQQVTLDLGTSISGNSQPLKFSFSVPSNAGAFCPAGSTGSSTSSGTGSTGTTGSGTTSSPPASATPAICPLRPAILATEGSPRAVIQFVNGSGFYPVQVTATDSSGRTTTQVIVLAYQASGGPALPAGTPGMSMAMPGAASGTGNTGSGSTGNSASSDSGSEA